MEASAVLCFNLVNSLFLPLVFLLLTVELFVDFDGKVFSYNPVILEHDHRSLGPDGYYLFQYALHLP